MANDVGENSGEKTPDFGLKLYIVIGISMFCVLASVVAIVFWLYSKRNSRKHKIHLKRDISEIPTMSKEVIDVRNMDRKESSKIVFTVNKERKEKGFGCVNEDNVIYIGSGSTESTISADTKSTSSVVSSDLPNIGWGQWYSLKELQIATGGFSTENVVGEGGYGIVYRGILPNNSVVAVKNLLNQKGQAEKDFKVEVEAIGKVRHKNLVSLIGYCAEDTRRMLVYEYVDNGNLEQWLHGDLAHISPLTWDTRMKIVGLWRHWRKKRIRKMDEKSFFEGCQKIIAYLHEGLEPKVIHRDIKSSNILLDKKWNARVSDFGLAKLLGCDASYVTTRVMGTFGCVAPEYASTGMLREGSDVYSFGVLLMGMISGRSPVDYTRPAEEVNMVDWFKGMVANRRGEEVLDPLIKVLPSSRSLKRALLVCLHCLDLDASKRPKMGQVVHMLEGDDFPFRAETRSALDTASSRAGRTVTNKNSTES